MRGISRPTAAVQVSPLRVLHFSKTDLLNLGQATSVELFLCIP